MHRRRRRVSGLVAALLAASLALPAPVAGAATCPTVFDQAFVDDLTRRYPGVELTAAAYDTATGCWHHLHQGRTLTTASVIKAQVLGAVLLRAQDERRGLTSWERSQIGPMIRYSFNPETSALYGHVGSVSGMQASDARLGVTSTAHTATFGLTSSTAVDRTRVALRLLWGGGGLHQAGREVAWSYLTDVHPLQQWGISAGVPAGWTVALKNGFYPASGLGWRVGSSGFVRRHDGDQGYALTVMTQRAPDQATGIRLAEEVSRRAAAVLTVGPAAPRAIDRARCVGARAGESWTGLASRLGLPAGRAADVQTTAGGNPSPLSGQQACSPDIVPMRVASGSTIDGAHRPVATDLGCNGPVDLLWYAPGGTADPLWWGRGDRRFAPSQRSVVGDYVPVPGDFDGDGCGDVLWYGAGIRPDSVWYGGSSVSSRAVTVDGAGYVPRAGDFDGDGHDDVLWYRPGSGSDRIWYGGARGRFTSVPVKVTGAYVPVVGDLNGDGTDDVFWYGPGALPEARWSGRVGERPLRSAQAATVNGRYRPVAADLDGDGADELIWYAPGEAADVRWDGPPPTTVQTGLRITGDHLPAAGDFDGDGIEDLAWFSPTGGADSVWWGGTSGITSGPLALR